MSHEEAHDRSHLKNLLVDVVRAVPRIEQHDLMRVLPRGELVDERHRLSQWASRVVLTDQEDHRRPHAVDEMDRVAVAHQLGNLIGSAAEQRPIVGLQLGREVLVAELVVPHWNAGHTRQPQGGVLAGSITVM